MQAYGWTGIDECPLLRLMPVHVFSSDKASAPPGGGPHSLPAISRASISIMPGIDDRNHQVEGWLFASAWLQWRPALLPRVAQCDWNLQC